MTESQAAKLDGLTSSLAEEMSNSKVRVGCRLLRFTVAKWMPDHLTAVAMAREAQ